MFQLKEQDYNWKRAMRWENTTIDSNTEKYYDRIWWIWNATTTGHIRKTRNLWNLKFIWTDDEEYEEIQKYNRKRWLWIENPYEETKCGDGCKFKH